MEQVHSFDAANQNHLHSRRYIGNGRYYQRGICKGIQQGDSFQCFTHPKHTLWVDKILTLQNSKGRMSQEARENSLYEAELVDKSFIVGMQYQPIRGI